jgi:hypothetical protein
MLFTKSLPALGLALSFAQASFARTPSDVKAQERVPVGGSIEIREPSEAVKVPAALPKFIYLRCNATGWDVQAGTRMHRVPGQPQLYRMTYDVKEDWMVSAYDECSLTATPVKDGWGAQQVYFGIKNGFLDAPSGSISLTFDTHADVYFKVKYPAKGRYTAYVSLGQYPFFAVVPHLNNGH